MLGTGQEAGVVQKMGFVVENELTCVGRWWKSVQSNLFFDLGPRNAWFVAMGDSLSHRRYGDLVATQKGFGFTSMD